VKEVLFLSDKYRDSMNNIASRKMLDAAGVKYRKLETDLKSITLDFVPEEAKK
jgi:dCMP deaminase